VPKPSLDTLDTLGTDILEGAEAVNDAGNLALEETLKQFDSQGEALENRPQTMGEARGRKRNFIKHLMAEYGVRGIDNCTKNIEDIKSSRFGGFLKLSSCGRITSNCSRVISLG
jgi:hypothetical protein